MAVDGARIVAVSEAPLQGRRVIDARGLVAAPGFIDIHSHATTRETARYQARDGVTTRLELEVGTWPVSAWYDAKQGRELLNYGTSVSHTALRYFIQTGDGASGLSALSDPRENFGDKKATAPLPPSALRRLAPLV